jgi:hypothetical protein
MSRHLATCSIAALAGAAMLTLSMGSASAFTLASPSLENSVASAQVEKVWWRHYWGGPRWGGGWGYHRRWCYWHPRACGW